MKDSTMAFSLSLALVSIFAGFTVYAADQSICHSGANVLLYENGSLKTCQLESDFESNSIQCKGARAVSFYTNGNLESCVLSKPATLDNNKCKEGGVVSFYLDGKLKSCVKPEN